MLRALVLVLALFSVFFISGCVSGPNPDGMGFISAPATAKDVVVASSSGSGMLQDPGVVENSITSITNNSGGGAGPIPVEEGVPAPTYDVVAVPINFGIRDIYAAPVSATEIYTSLGIEFSNGGSKELFVSAYVETNGSKLGTTEQTISRDNQWASVRFSGLVPDTEYDVYWTIRDTSGNKLIESKHRNVRTLQPLSIRVEQVRMVATKIRKGWNTTVYVGAGSSPRNRHALDPRLQLFAELMAMEKEAGALVTVGEDMRGALPLDVANRLHTALEMGSGVDATPLNVGVFILLQFVEDWHHMRDYEITNDVIFENVEKRKALSIAESAVSTLGLRMSKKSAPSVPKLPGLSKAARENFEAGLYGALAAYTATGKSKSEKLSPGDALMILIKGTIAAAYQTMGESYSAVFGYNGWENSTFSDRLGYLRWVLQETLDREEAVIVLSQSSDLSPSQREEIKESVRQMRFAVHFYREAFKHFLMSAVRERMEKADGLMDVLKEQYVSAWASSGQKGK